MQPEPTQPAARQEKEGCLAERYGPWHFALALMVMFFAAFPRVLTGAQTFFRFDFGVLAFPFVHYQRECFWRGELPLWNPLSNCGAPFLAQWGTMTLYPFTLIYLLLPMPWSLNLFCLAHLVWGGVGMYLLAHRWTGSRMAASVAGTAFALSGVSLSCLIWPNYTVALGWMPWVVWRGEAAWRGGHRNLVLAALAAAMQMLTGVPEIILLTWAILIALALSEWISLRPIETCSPTVDQQQDPSPGLRPPSPLRGERGCPAVISKGTSWQIWLRLGLIILLVAGLAAAQLLPFFDLLAHSQRDRTAATVKWAMPAWGWANLIVPMFHYGKTVQGIFFQQTQEFLASYYPGVLTLTLAALGVWRVRRRRVRLLAAAGIFALLMASGDNGFLYGWLKSFIPVVGIARYPVKFVIVLAFAMPVLAAFGARWCQDRAGEAEAGRWRPLLIAGGSTVVLAIALLVYLNRNPSRYDWPPVTTPNAVQRIVLLAAGVGLLIQTLRATDLRTKLICGGGILTMMALDAFTQLPEHNPTIPADLMTPGMAREAGHFNPSPRHGESRLMIGPSADDYMLNNATASFDDDFLGRRLVFWSNLNALDDVPKVNGSSTLRIREENDVQSLLYTATNRSFSGLMNFLGVSQISAPGKIVEWTNRASYLPLATIGQRPVFLDANQTLDHLADPVFNPRDEVLLPPEARSTVTVTNRTPAKIVASQFSTQRAQIEYEASEPSLMVVAQTFYHPWRASVDGQPATLLRANHAFQALQVPAGKHIVILEYHDRRFLVGLAISMLSLGICGILWRRGR